MKRLAAVRVAVCGAALLVGGAVTRGDQVVIATATISGNVSVGGLPISSVYVYASAAGLTSSSYSRSFSLPHPSTAPYTLTVGFPQGTTPTYSVRPEVRTDSNRDYLQMEATNVQVSEGQTSAADIGLANPGFITAVISVTDGGTLNSAYVQAYRGSWYAWTSTTPSAGFTFPVVPGTGITVNGSASVTASAAGGGATSSVSLPNRTVDVAAGQTVQVSYTLTPPAPPPTPTGSIGGTVGLPGAATVNQFWVGASGPLSKSQGLIPSGNMASYSLTGLAAGNYSVYGYAYLNNSDDYLQFPSVSFTPSQNVTVGTGASTVGVSASQAYIDGAVHLTGLQASTPTFVNTSYVYAYPFDATTSGGYAYDRLNVATAAFDLVVTPGNWTVRRFDGRLSRSSPYLNQTYFYYDDYRPGRTVTAAAGAVSTIDFDLSVGEVALRVSLANGGALSSPRIYGSCYQRAQNGTILWYYYFDSTSNQVNVTEGRVSFVGPAGECTVDGTVVVNGATLGIPRQTLTVTAGVSKDIDAGGPLLTVSAPAPESYVSSNAVIVTGTASDDTAIASVRVNGLDATLTPTAQPGEVAFTRQITLSQRGPNQITTTAADVANPPKTTTDTRTVYWDEGPPTLSFAPADGTSTSAASVQVAGQADDDAGISRVVVNGTQVAFSSTGDSARPREVQFAANIALADGANTITVSVTDISNRVTTESHTVTRESQVATALTASNATGSYGGSTTMSARLAELGTGNAVAGASLQFTVAGRTATAQTGADGYATVPGFSLSGVSAGTHVIQVAFAGDAQRQASNASAVLTVARISPSLTWSAPAPITYGTALGPAQLNATADVPGTYAYSPLAGDVPGAGVHMLSVTFTPTDTTNYTTATTTVPLTVNQATPIITWVQPAAITYGTVLSATQLNATANVTGSFAYTAAAGTMLNAGTPTLSVVFTPTDTANYTTATATVPLTVNKATPTVAWPPPAPIVFPTALGASQLNAAASVPGSIDYSPSTGTVLAAGFHTLSAAFTPADTLNYTTAGATAVLVVNAAPSIASVTGPAAPIALGGAATISAAFSDPATGDTHTCTFAWDDGGSTGPGAASAGSCSASRTYAAAGVYEVAVTVTDDDGLSSTGRFQYVVVYDPNAGFVTGGGWITSGPGSYVADSSLTGKATFGFVSKYQKGKTVPTGETQFQFEVATFRFQSVSYDWLVVSGARAQYKGRGTVNGVGDYGFLLTATDGQLTGGGGMDRFRIKIWDIASGAVVYDNVLGASDDLDTASPQALGGGSVVIHSR